MSYVNMKNFKSKLIIYNIGGENIYMHMFRVIQYIFSVV